MNHLWVRAEERANEERVGLVPDGAAKLIAAGYSVTVEEDATRAVPVDGYARAGCAIAPSGSWREAPQDVVVLGLKELPEDGLPLKHRHIMFGHAYKGQPSGQRLLAQFKAGGGALYDLEYLTDPDGRRVAAFGYWAGYAGAAVALKVWLAQMRGEAMQSVGVYPSSKALLEDLKLEMPEDRPNCLIIGAHGRVGTGAFDLLDALSIPATRWDMAETASGGPFPEILQHEIFLNCILARPGTPVFVPETAKQSARALSVIGDIACDPDSKFSPIKVYDRVTTWEEPALRVHTDPVLDVTAIDNLPSMLPVESSEDFAAQLLPSLLALRDMDQGVWGRARMLFDQAIA